MFQRIATGLGLVSGSAAAFFVYAGESKKPDEAGSGMTDFQHTSPWDSNWDRRDPASCVKPPMDSSEREQKRVNEELLKAKPTATRYLYLIRDGQFNLYGDSDKDRVLTEIGRKQAQLTGQRLKQLGFPYTRIVHSTMTRAIETAELIHEHIQDVPVESCELIREGEPVPPEPPFGIMRPESKFFSDGARIEAGFRKYFHRASPSQKKDSHEILVCHANVLRYWICRAMQLPPEAWARISLANCSITLVSINPNGRLLVRSIGDTGHFPKEYLTLG